MTYTLFDLIRSYPGGVAELAIASHVGLKTLYKVAEGRHSRVPNSALEDITEAFEGRQARDEEVTTARLEKMWYASRKRFQKEHG